MAGPVPAIYTATVVRRMAGTGPAMTIEAVSSMRGSAAVRPPWT
jgi:hypothetical protein